MAMLAFSRQNKNTLSIEVTDDDGTPQVQLILNRYKPKDVQFLAELWNVPQPEALAKVNSVCECTEDGYIDTVDFEPRPGLIESILNGTPVEPTIPDPTDTSKPPQPEAAQPIQLVIHVRELNQLKQHGRAFSNTNVEQCFRDALASACSNPDSVEPLIEWTDGNTFHCLDIDYHTLKDALTYEELSNIVSRIKPQPLAWHMSHGHGAKLYYVASPGYTACELASIAGISWLAVDPRATFDLIRSTRHPCFARSRDNCVPPCDSLEQVAFVYGQSDVSAIRKVLLSDVEYSDVEAFLNERGWYFGKTLPHSECPIQPTNDQKENVFIGEKGIFCHRCQAKGYGGKTPGFMSYSQLVGTVDNRVTTMLRNFCHYEHAKVILANVFPHVPSKIMEDVYRVMLKIVHMPEDPRIPLAMVAGKGFVRVRGQWVTHDGSESLTDGKPAFINSLPATKFVKRGGEDAGKLLPDVSRVVAFLNAGELDEYGYQDISFLRGAKIYGQHLPHKDGENIKVVIRPEFKNNVPQYVHPSKRMPSEEAWRFLSQEFTGIDRNYIKLLIASKGASEGRLAQCPYLLVAGPSGAGKSTSVHIAAGICGDKADEPIFHPHVDRFRQSLMDASRNSGFVCINEVFKMAERAKLSYTQALDPMLSLTEDSRSHVLYVGSVPFGRLPVFVLTDIDIPSEVERDAQLARRFTFYRLGQANNWQDNLVRQNFRPHEFRLLSYDHNAAADAILSEVIDEFFQTPIPLYEIAKSLQAGSLDTFSGEKERSDEVMAKFYYEVCNAPPISGTHTNRYNPLKGWKMIDRSLQQPINELWDDLCDGRSPEEWQRSRILSSQDWRKVLGIDFNIVCEIKPYRGNNVVYVRFRSVENSRNPDWINGRSVKG